MATSGIRTNAGSEWSFYHVEQANLDLVVANLLEKCLDRRLRVVIRAADETLQRLDGALWTAREESFLPHGLVGAEEVHQPILLSPTGDPRNGARVALLLDGCDAFEAPFERCLVVFEGNDAEARAAARDQYRRAISRGDAARYFQQTGDGGWAERSAAKNSSGEG